MTILKITDLQTLRSYTHFEVSSIHTEGIRVFVGPCGCVKSTLCVTIAVWIQNAEVFEN